jgi:hypothetical protein
MNSLLLSTEKRMQEEEAESKKGSSDPYQTQAHDFLKNHSEVRTEMIVPLLVKGEDGSEVNLKANSAMDMALKRH